MSESSHKQKIVMATGVFDLIHPGHIYYLEESRKLGDSLVVLVTNDTVVRNTKGEPLFNQQSRQHLVASLRCVDDVIIPVETNRDSYYKIVLEVNPDIISLGHDQSFSEVELLAELKTHGWQGSIIRLPKYPHQEVSSSQLKATIRSNHGL